MKRWILPAALVLAACGGTPPEGGPEMSPPDPEVLMEADRAFNDDVAEGGSAAWVSWFAEDGAMIHQGVGEIVGATEIQAAVESLDDPAVTLTWEPLRAEISASGDLGWTTGEYTSLFTAPDGTVTEGHGRYVSIWRLQDDGSWKVVMDLGNPTGDPPGA